MVIKLGVDALVIEKEYTYTADICDEWVKYPVMTIGTDSYLVSADVNCEPDNNFSYDFQIGRYSSIGPNQYILMDANHAYELPCQGRIKSNFPHAVRPLSRKCHVYIMNDVWMGANCTILSGVTIGNGAVVAANSVVTRDVPPFSIVAGNPAKVVKYRFSDEQIKALSLIRWWNWSHEKVVECESELYGNIDSFIEKHIDDAKNGIARIQPVDIPRIEGATGKRFLYFPDFDQTYFTYLRVIGEFARSHHNKKDELLLIMKNDNGLPIRMRLLDSVFSNYDQYNCFVNIYSDTIQFEEALFANTDYYITNRNEDNIRHMDMAYQYQVGVLSAVDYPLFREG